MDTRGVSGQGEGASTRRIAVVGVIISNREKAAPRVNEVLGLHADIIVGRMGIPYRERDIAVIALIVDGTTDDIGSLTGKLGSIEGVRVRSCVAV
ncbi:MAG TPA: CopG family transcriptional regulator [Firmicutes bacterium]|nr:CopG family transcriptional regulator [Bacillota bacterium]